MNIADILRWKNKITSAPTQQTQQTQQPPPAKHPKLGLLGKLGTPEAQNVFGTAPEPFPADWLERFDEEQLGRLAIRTVDGGLSDADALAAEGLVAA